MPEASHSEIINKLDEFIRKYYKNQLLRGFLYSAGLCIVFYLAAVLLEYGGEFETSFRTFLFYSWIISTLFVIGFYILKPLSKLYRLGKIISYEQAALIIGTHFTNVQDKLLNYLQLSQQSVSIDSDALWKASIHQKISELRPISFSSAIRLSENRKYIKWVMIPFAMLLILFFGAPSVLTESTRRLVNYDRHFEKVAPFRFEIQNKNLSAVQQEDFTLDIKILGEEVPAEVFIESGGSPLKLEKEKTDLFHYTFKNLQKNITFHFSANGFSSPEYELTVVAKPTLLDFTIQLDYPAYVGKPDEQVRNSGDLLVPQGTKVSWLFKTKNSDQFFIGFSDTLCRVLPRSQNTFSFSRSFFRTENYSLLPSNPSVPFGDSVFYTISVVPDAYPQIEMTEQRDSLHPKNIYLSGSVKDDYGISSLKFHYTLYSKDSSGNVSERKESFILPSQKNASLQPFYHFFDLNSISINPGDKVEYFVEVFDNDAVNGAKSSRSQTLIYRAPTNDEINKETNNNNSKIEKNMEEALKEATQLQKQISDISRQIQEKKEMGWEEKKKLQELLNRQNDLKNKVEQIKKENNRNNELRNEFSPPSQELMEKQQELEKLMENLMTPELQKLFDELQKLMEKMADKQKIQETLEKMKLSDKDMEKELDRNLELFKQMDVEQELDNAIKKLDELKKDQDNLSKNTNPDKKAEEKILNEKKEQINKQLSDIKKQSEQLKNQHGDNKEKLDALSSKEDELKKQLDELKKQIESNKQNSKSNEELNKEQKDLSEKFNELKKDLNELDKKNKELENPNKLPEMDQMKQEISKDQQSAEQQLQQNDKKGSSKSQKNAADKMQEMQNMMEMAQQQMSQEQEGEDMEAIRQLLENLLHLSFEQEDLLNNTKKAKATDPNYTRLGQAQQRLKAEAKKVEDTLLAISKRQPKISSGVNKEINAIQLNMSKSISALEERMSYEAASRQQNIMTSINNLALMLNESLEQLQQAAQKKGGSPGGGSCTKPGGNGQKPSMGNMRKMQDALNKQLQEMKDAMEKGGQKPGKKQGQGGMGGVSSEQFARAAAQQEALRKMYQEALKNLKEGGKNPGGNMANLMEQTENELVNKIISQQTLTRQQEILTRLLESEKAEQERELDEKRESNESKEQQISNQKLFLEYKRIKEQELELLKTVPPSLHPYYKEKVAEYFNQSSK